MPLAEAQAMPFFSPDLKVSTVSMSFIARLAAPLSAIWLGQCQEPMKKRNPAVLDAFRNLQPC